MIKICLSLILIILLVSCHQKKPISYKSYQAISCDSKDNFKKKYIFNKNNGYLYFYDPISNSFLPLSKTNEDGYYGEFFNEIYSKLDRNILKITKLNYKYHLNNGYFKIEDVINLNSLVLIRKYKNDKNKLVSFKVKCIWIDPRLSIR